MKKILLSISILISGLTCFAQAPSPLTKEDFLKIETEINLKAQKLEESFIEKGQVADYFNKFHVDFTVDTFKIEERLRLKLDIDYSTSGMVTSTLDANNDYDKLLNKYYKQLLKSLNEQDKEVLRKAQRNWIKFRDAELELNGLLTEDYYSGGGTIQRVIAASRVLELTQNRVIELYHYLDRKMESY